MASSVPPSFLVSLVPGSQKLVEDRSRLIMHVIMLLWSRGPQKLSPQDRSQVDVMSYDARSRLAAANKEGTHRQPSHRELL